MPGSKKVHVKTFGCQMNVYDSERMTEALAPHGYQPTDVLEDADVIVLNTCHIREKAAEKVYSELGRLRQLKDERGARGLATAIAVAGCVAQAEGAEIIARAPVVDLVVGPQSYHRLPDLLLRSQSEGRRLVDTSFPDEDKFGKLPDREPNTVATPTVGHSAAFLTVQEGCDKFCTFCVVPYTRGMEFSRPVDTLVAEATKLVARGVRDLTLLGQNVNAFHGEGPDGRAWSLARLIGRLAQIEGIERLRYTTSHPRDMGDDLIAAHRNEPKLMPYLHLPVQSGADRILAAMNRKHTAGDYRRLVDKIRRARPDIALSTDFIVGFPGETEDEFQATLGLVTEIGFAQAYSFKYSGRPGTPAAKLEEQVAEDVKADRLARLQDVLESQTRQFNAGCVGRTFQVLFERHGRRDGQLVGRSPYLQPVYAAGDPGLLGRVMPVEISAAGPNSLTGVIRAV
ncbi:MAG: tRNA (N6-isopentenyl adenosine(37)-C2)-methylthiotransferase MiaB [Hyphomicrobiaceae bacterium]|nr:tRNA (N6-isopentenyl adenosine(37)-C2)-methylthiotransferase MiaB [Hyphomicrobiaceae bacterium]